MVVYYQHIGEKLAARDFPRSLGTVAEGLKRFHVEDIEPFLQHLTALEQEDIRRKIKTLTPTGFQIWGIPSGAMRVLSRMATGDYLMLLETTDFAYCGQVVHRTSELCHDLSVHIWGEQRFPIIILLQGELISYGWHEFVAAFGFAANYHMRGNTANVGPERVTASRYGNEDAFIAHLLSTKGTNPFDQHVDFRAFADGLTQHLRMVKSVERDRQFRDAVFARCGSACAFCGLDVSVVLDAAHVVPKSAHGSDDPRNGLPLCAVHHRLFDAHWLSVRPYDLAIVAAPPITLEQVHVTRTAVPAAAAPHSDALKVRWEQFSALREKPATSLLSRGRTSHT